MSLTCSENKQNEKEIKLQQEIKLEQETKLKQETKPQKEQSKSEQVYLYPRFHKYKDMHAKEAKLVLNSILGLGEFLSHNPNSHLFLESLIEDAREENLSTNPFCGVSRFIFPAGLPKKIEKLNSLQIEFLEEFREQTLYFLGVTNHIHKTGPRDAIISIDKSLEELEKQIGLPLSQIMDEPRVNRLMIDEREDLAIAEVERFLIDFPTENVVLAFGGYHIPGLVRRLEERKIMVSVVENEYTIFQSKATAEMKNKGASEKKESE